jgi:hypothetical protein
MDKTQILERIDQLDKEVDVAAESARRHKHASQGTERLQLQVECKNAGGHVYLDSFLGHGVSRSCMFCGRDENADKNVIARNLSTSVYP